jgi:hypothetical protein
LERPSRFGVADWFMWIALAVAPPFFSAIVALLIRDALRMGSTCSPVIGLCGMSNRPMLHDARVGSGGMNRKRMAALAEKVRIAAIYVAFSGLIRGWSYWLWLAVKVGSFGMFAFGVFFPLAIVAAILGLWELLLEMPSWLLHLLS